MGAQDAEVVQALFEAYNSEDIESVLALAHANVEIDVPPALSTEPDVYRGHDGMRRYFESFSEVMSEIRFAAESVWEGAEETVISMRITARGRHTAIEVEQRMAGVWRIRDGLVVRVRVFASVEEALAAAGLGVSPSSG